MQERHRHVTDDFTVIRQLQSPVVTELAEGGGFNSLGRTERVEFVPLFRDDRQHHPFLRLADPDLGVRQAGVLERTFFEPDDRAGVLAHFTDGAAESARAAIGDGVIQILVARLQDHIHHHLLGDGVADLHGTARNRFALMRQLGGGERRAVNAVAAGAASDRDDQVARMNFLLALVDRDHRHGPAIDQRVPEIPFVKEDGSVDGRNPHPVAVVADTGHDSLHHQLRMQRPRRQRVVRCIGRREAEDIAVADRFRTQSRAERIADHAAEPRVGPAVRFDGRRMVVRFDLEADVLLVVKLDDAGVVLEDADAPVVRAKLAADLDRRAKHGLLEHVLEDPLALFVAVADAAFERLVRTVLAPRLRDRFQFDVSRVSLLLNPVLFDRPHLGEAQIELSVFAEMHQRVVVHRADRHGAQLELVLGPGPDPVHVQRANDDPFDGVVGQHPLADAVEVGIRHISFEPVLATGRDRVDGEAEILERLLSAQCHVVGDARLEQDVEESSVE